jgi:rRNA-processing protein FCF1
VPSSVLGELDRLVERGVDGAAAARRLAGRYPVLPTDRRGDAGVLAGARSEAAWVLTGDRALLRRAGALGLRGLAPRGRGELAIVLPRRLCKRNPPVRGDVP